MYLNHKVQPLNSTSLNDLNDSDKLFGLPRRIVAVESLIFLGYQYQSFRSYLNSILLHEQEHIHSEQFYLQIISLTTTLRKPIYMPAISQVFDVSSILMLMSKVDWEIKDVVYEHSDYVDYIIQV